MAPQAREHETLYQHDIGITRIRRVLSRRAAAELADEPVAMLKPVATEAHHA
jgi:ABC-type phosphate/phosphonate transport system ATPase subunit